MTTGRGQLRRRHLVWDWNGTILGDGGALIRSVISAFASTGFSRTPIGVGDHQRHFTRPIAEFFDKLARRPLTEAEHVLLRERFDLAYETHSANVDLAPGARETLSAWAEAGHSQSLLSMCPHETLVPLVEKRGIQAFFSRIDGFRGPGPDTKTTHLQEHLRLLGPVDPGDVVLVGDTVDDARAAEEAGIACVIYHSGEDALESIGHFDGLAVPVVRSLPEALAEAVPASFRPGVPEAGSP